MRSLHCTPWALPQDDYIILQGANLVVFPRNITFIIDRTNPSLRGVPCGRDDEAIYIFLKKAGRYKKWDCFASLAMTYNQYT